jgi:hypothetical protein
MAYSLNLFLQIEEGKTFLFLSLLFIPFNKKMEHDFRTRLNVKGFFHEIKEKQIVKDESKILCIYEGYYHLKALSQYSKMSFNRDICNEHIRIENFKKAESIRDHDLVIRYLSDNQELVREGNRNWEGVKSLYKSDSFVVYLLK